MLLLFTVHTEATDWLYYRKYPSLRVTSAHSQSTAAKGLIKSTSKGVNVDTRWPWCHTTPRHVTHTLVGESVQGGAKLLGGRGDQLEKERKQAHVTKTVHESIKSWKRYEKNLHQRTTSKEFTCTRMYKHATDTPHLSVGSLVTFLLLNAK